MPTFVEGGVGTRPESDHVSVGTTATAIVAADPHRETLLLVNASDAAIYLGGADVTTANGLYLASGSALALPRERGGSGAWYAIAGAAGKTLSYTSFR